MPEKYYVRGDSKSIFESMTKEEILEAITQAIQTGQIAQLDTGFITILKEINKGKALRFWVGTSAEFNALEQQETNVLYIKTDDTSAQDISTALQAQAAQIQEHAEQLNDISGKYVKARAAWVFDEIAAGDSDETYFYLDNFVYTEAENNPVVMVSPVLTRNDTFNPDLEYYGYILYDSTAEQGRQTKLVFGVRNRGTEAAQPPDVACVVI